MSSTVDSARSWSRTNQLILAAAARLGVEAGPVSSEPGDFFVRLGSVIVSKTRSPFLTQVAQTLANNKFVSRELLGAHGLPVVASELFDEARDPRRDPAARARAQAALARHGEVVVKPNWGNRGVGIVTGVRDLDALLAAYAHARDHDRDEEVVVEPFVPGINLRVAVIGGRVEAVAEITRPRLRGDGRRVAALVAELNADGRRGSWDRPALVPLDQIEDELVAGRLEAEGLALDDVLAPGVELELCFEESEVIDRSDALHPGWAAAAIEAADLLGVDVAGVDLRGPAAGLFDAGPASADSSGGAGPQAVILEVNALPALHLHALPTAGLAQPVFEAFVAYCVQLPGAPAPRARVKV